jgi:radical SAM superfamily enzyme YgiQ (UPF0313 family)
MRIGLIAMSGIRVQDPELQRWGMTLPGFVERGQVIASMPSLGLLTLASLTPERHQVEYHEVRDFANANDLPSFDLVAISTLTAQAYEAYTIADRYREQGTIVIIGGLHATAIPDEARQHADAVVAGEAETVWPHVLADAEAGELNGIYRPEEDFDLAKAPMPAFERLDIERYNRIPIQTTRGCPWRCSFCASSIMLTPRYKQKPMGKVLAEVEAVCSRWPRPFIELADDNSFVNRQYWLKLLPELAKRSIRWFTETDISVADDPQLLRLMRQAGCEEVLIGLESPNDADLRSLETRRDWKRQRQPGYVEAVQRIQSHGIRVNGCFILGLDGQTPAIFEKLPRYVDELELYDVQITLSTPFPGTPFYRKMCQADRMFEERPWDRMTLFDLTFEPTPMTTDELRTGFHDLAKTLYSEDATHRRRQRFRDRYLRPNRQSDWSAA